jgi:hypothetical protein
MGFFIPNIMDNTIHESTKQLYMKKGDHDIWGKVPGKAGTKVIRAYSMFNVTNPSEIQAGTENPKLVEVGKVNLQEFSEFQNWEY